MRRCLPLLVAVLLVAGLPAPVAGATEPADPAAWYADLASRAAPTVRAGTAPRADLRQTSSCSQSTVQDPPDSLALDIAVAGGAHFCDTGNLVVSALTYDAWLRTELDFFAVHLDVDGNPANGCLQGDYAALGWYDLGLVAAFFRTPDCDHVTVITDLFIDRVGAVDFIGMVLPRSLLGATATVGWSAVLISVYGDIDLAPNTGVQRWALDGAPPPPPAPAPPAPTPPPPAPTPPPPAPPAPAPPPATGGIPSVVPFDGDPATTSRVDTADPTAAAVGISRARFADDGARWVVLSRADDFPDSLAGAALTADGPLLLTGTSTLPAVTATEIDRVLPAGGTVYLLGGTTAIGAAVEQQLAGRGHLVRRLAGPSRVETALAVADEVRSVYPSSTGVLVARAAGTAADPTAGWADSVTGGAYAAHAHLPVLVTDTGALHPAVAAWLAARQPSGAVLLGGTSALSDAVAAALPGARRVAGEDRAATAVAIARDLWGVATDGPRRHVVVNGYDTRGWAFGLAVAGLAADHAAPLLVTSSSSVPPATLAAVTSCGPQQVDLLLVGDRSVIGDPVVAQLDSADGGHCPTVGAD